ncbi:MAG: hypothetical protein ACXAEX_20155, partial [Promethearchaeota archaeon]
MKIVRIGNSPIISPSKHPSLGSNIQGPSLIKVPQWIDAPYGKYYLYFADHKGQYIRLAYSNKIQGPWKIHVPGSLQIENSYYPTKPPMVNEKILNQIKTKAEINGIDFSKLSHDLITELTTPHIASPDVHVDNENRRIIMYFHGLQDFAKQVSRVALSKDGILFQALPTVIGRTYMRIFKHDGFTYAMAMPGQFYRSEDGLTNFEEGPLLFNSNMRHSALLIRGNCLYVFWTQVGDTPERILLSTIDILGDWMEWKESRAVEVLRPEESWEGADAPLEPSVRSVAYGIVNQLRDPAVYVEDDRVFLLYAVAGESGIGLAEIIFNK